MSKSTTQLQADIAANYADNTSGSITPVLLRSGLNDITSSFGYGTYLTSNASVQAGSINYCDTSGGSFSVTLPTSGTSGDIVKFRDARGTWGTTNLSILPSANNIDSNAGTLTCDVSDVNFDLVWRGGGVGWSAQFDISTLARQASIIRNSIAAFSGHASMLGVGLGTATAGALSVAGLGTFLARGDFTGLTSWSPSDKSANIALSGGNLIATHSGALDGNVRSNTAGVAGRYFEVVFSQAANVGIGVANLTQSLSAYPGNPNGAGYFNSGYFEYPGSGFSNVTTGYVANDVVGVGYVSDGGGGFNIKWFVNGLLKATALAVPTGAIYPIFYAKAAGDAGTANFGATAFSFLPAGLVGWNT